MQVQEDPLQDDEIQRVLLLLKHNILEDADLLLIATLWLLLGVVGTT